MVSLILRVFLCVLDSEDLIARTTIVGIIMAFRKCTLEALNSALSYRIPFLLSSISDFKKNIPDKSSNVGERVVTQHTHTHTERFRPYCSS